LISATTAEEIKPIPTLLFPDSRNRQYLTTTLIVRKYLFLYVFNLRWAVIAGPLRDGRDLPEPFTIKTFRDWIRHGLEENL